MTVDVVEILGPLSKVSTLTDARNFDWALVEITSLEIFYLYSQKTSVPRVQSIINSLPQQSTIVTAMMKSNGRTMGIISTNPTLMQLPPSIAFQEMWTVQLDGPLGVYEPPLAMDYSNLFLKNMEIVDPGLSVRMVQAYMDTLSQEIHKHPLPILFRHIKLSLISKLPWVVKSLSQSLILGLKPMIPGLAPPLLSSGQRIPRRLSPIPSFP
jgi:hypothetical protein